MAIVYQISLNGDAYDARDKTWDQMVSETGCKPRKEWVDPLLNRPLLKGEFGCSVSHLRVWEKIAESNCNGIILEEDVVFSGIDVDEVEELLGKYDSVWLGYRWNTLGYWYNTHAYAITPETALKLIDGFKDGIIPADEWVPYKLKDAKNYFYPEEVVKQIPRSTRPSTIEETEEMNLEAMAAMSGVTTEEIKDFLTSDSVNMHIVTVATDESKMWALDQSSKTFDVTVHNIGKGSDWHDDMEGPAGLPKLDMMKEFLKDLTQDDIVLFMDAYDTFFVKSPLELLSRFKDFNVDILFGAENSFWPEDEFLQHRWDEKHKDQHYKYLNSGLYIGYAGALFDFFNQSTPSHWGDDQRACQLLFSKTWDGIVDKGYNFPYKVALDHEGYIFQNHDFEAIVHGDEILGPICAPCVYHGNGGDDAKDYFESLAGTLGYHMPLPQPVPYLMTLDYEEVAPEILVTDFLTDRQCEYLIHKSEQFGNWGELEGDKFPAQEIRLRELGLWDEYENLWTEKLGKIAMNHWQPYQHLGLRDAFTMKYTMDTQKELGYHTDASLVTGSVKLNDNYEGAELVFPRQDFNNIKVPVGKCILFPSDVTHGHYVPELKSGVKYSLTMWTKRHQGDIN